MTTTYFNAALESKSSPAFSHLQTILIEPWLIVAAVSFWFVALPFVAVSVFCAMVCDTLVTMKSRRAALPNPLFLRRSGSPEIAPALSSHRTVRPGHV